MNVFTASLWITILTTMLVKYCDVLHLCTSRLERGVVMCQVDTKNDTFTFRDIDPSLCTHILVVIKDAITDNGTLSTEDAINSYFKDDADLSTLESFKAQDIRVGIKIGIFLMKYGPKQRRFLDMADDPALRKVYVDSLLSFMRKYDLNLVEITIESFQKINSLGALTEDISRVVRARGWQIGVTVYGLPGIPFDPVDLAKNVDYFNVRGYNYNFWEVHAGTNAPIESLYGDNFTVKYSLERIISSVGANCVVLTIPMFGLEWVFPESPTEPGPGSFLNKNYKVLSNSYNEICLRNFRGECHRFDHWDKITRTPWAVCSGDSYISYDNARSVREKVNLALKMGIKGISAYTIDRDDYLNKCEEGNYPLLRAAQRIRQ